MNSARERVLRGACGVFGHRWVWKIRDDWPYHMCTRCGAGWEVGRPRPRDFEDFKASVLSNCRPHGLAASEVWRDASLRYPEMSASDLLRLAERIVMELLAEGGVRLMRGPRAGPKHERRAVEDPENTIRQWSTWTTDVDEVTWVEAAGTD